jgi:uncharacterized protein YecT (DUF1311 family)
MRYLAVLFLIASLPGIAQNSEKYRTCNDKAKTQAEMNACAGEEAASIDAELNSVYRKLLLKAATQQDAVAKIKIAERAWVAYRDAYIEAMYPAKDKQAEYGSIYPMEVELLRAKLAQQQISALKELLQQYSGAGASETGRPGVTYSYAMASATRPSSNNAQLPLKSSPPFLCCAISPSELEEQSRREF